MVRPRKTTTDARPSCCAREGRRPHHGTVFRCEREAGARWAIAVKAARIPLLLAAIVLALGLLGWFQYSTAPGLAIVEHEDRGQELGGLDNLLLIYAKGIARVSGHLLRHGYAEEAGVLARRVVRVRQRILGPEHPETAAAAALAARLAGRSESRAARIDDAAPPTGYSKSRQRRE